MRSLLLKAASRKARRTLSVISRHFQRPWSIHKRRKTEEFQSLEKTDWIGIFSSASSQVFFSHRSHSSDVLCAPCWCLSCFSSGAVCLFLHLLSLLSLYRSRASRHLCMWESLTGLLPPDLCVHHPDANTTWLGVHIMDHSTEWACQYCRVLVTLICSFSKTRLAANGSDNNIFWFFFSWAQNTHFGGLIKNEVLTDAILHRIVSHPDHNFSYKRLAGSHAFDDA